MTSRDERQARAHFSERYAVPTPLTLGDIDVAGGTFDVALWAKNLTNANYNYFDFRVAGRNTTTRYNDPRTYGLEARVRF